MSLLIAVQEMEGGRRPAQGQEVGAGQDDRRPHAPSVGEYYPGPPDRNVERRRIVSTLNFS